MTRHGLAWLSIDTAKDPTKPHHHPASVAPRRAVPRPLQGTDIGSGEPRGAGKWLRASAEQRDKERLLWFLALSYQLSELAHEVGTPSPASDQPLVK